MEPKRPTSSGPRFLRSLGRFLAGLGYLFAVAVIFSAVARVALLPTFLAVVAGAAFCTTLALVWLMRWVFREDRRRGQFGLASLFFLTTFVAIYFAVVRWLVVSSRPGGSGRPSDGLELFVIVGRLCVFLAVVAVPFLLGMAESLVWLAAWIVRRPAVQRWLLGRRLPPGED